MKAAYRCAHCGEACAVDYVREWGRHKASDGYGPRPVCACLVPAVGAPLALKPGRDPRDPMSWEQPMQVCGGPLMAEQVADSFKLPALEEILPTTPGVPGELELTLRARIAELERELEEVS